MYNPPIIYTISILNIFNLFGNRKIKKMQNPVDCLGFASSHYFVIPFDMKCFHCGCRLSQGDIEHLRSALYHLSTVSHHFKIGPWFPLESFSIDIPLSFQFRIYHFFLFVSFASFQMILLKKTHIHPSLCHSIFDQTVN